MLKKCWLFLFWILGFTVLKSQAVKLDSVVISILRQDLLESRVPWNVQRIQNEIDENKFCRSVPDAISTLPGLMVQKTNLGGGSPYINGLTGNQVLILIDGIRMNNSIFRYGPNQYLNTVDIFGLESIEVATGTGSVQYGSDALGGIVSLMSHVPKYLNSKKNNQENNFTIKSILPFQELSVNYNCDGNVGKLAYFASASLRKFGDIIAPSPIGKQTPTGFNECNGSVNLRYSDKNGEWLFSSQYIQQTHVPVYHKYILESYKLNEMSLQARNMTYLKRKILLNKVNLNSSFGVIRSDEHRRLQKNKSNVIRFEKDQVNTYFGILQMDFKLSKELYITSGVELYTDFVKSSRVDKELSTNLEISKRGLYPDNSSMFQSSGYLMLNRKLNQSHFFMGSRFHYSKIRLYDKNVGDIEDNCNALIYNFGYFIDISKWSGLYLNVGTGFRAPNLDDLGSMGIVDFRYEIPKYDLDPEFSRSLEIGWKLTKQTSIFRLNLNYTNLIGQITRIKLNSDSILGYPVYQKENTENSHVYTSTIDWIQLISKDLRIRSGGSLCFGLNETKQEPMRRIPPLNGFLEVKFSLNKSFKLNLEFQFVNEQKRLATADIADNRIGVNGTNGYQILNISMVKTWSKVRLDITLRNLFNEVAKVHGSGIYMPGRCIELIMHF